MHRLFVAIDLPAEIKAAVLSLQCPIRGAKWVTEEQLHLTLRFIGDADDDLLHEITTGLSGILAAPFSLALMGVGYFPPKRNPKVLWVGVGSSDALHNLQNDIEKVLLRNGLEPETRPFSPHITLARLKETLPAQLAPFLQKNNRFTTPIFPVTGFTLYSSRLAPQGAIHCQEASFPLFG